MKTTAAQTAQEIRKVLKHIHPEIKFQITSKSYSGGNSVEIQYTNGVATKEIEKIVNCFEYGSFNGMEDIYEYTNTNKNIPQVKYIFVNRHLSETIEEEAKKYIYNRYNQDDINNCYRIENAIYKLTLEMDLSNGFNNESAKEINYNILSN